MSVPHTKNHILYSGSTRSISNRRMENSQLKDCSTTTTQVSGRPFFSTSTEKTSRREKDLYERLDEMNEAILASAQEM